MVKHVRWDDIAWERMNPLLDRKFFTDGSVTMARFHLRKGALVPVHQHENEQYSHVLQGALKFLIEGREVLVSAGEVLCIPPHAPHSAEAVEDTLVLDLFTPPRSDWETRQDAYLRDAAK